MEKGDYRNYIRIRGASEHNLKNIDVDIPRDSLVVLTGLSGSGKSSLAFDTIYAEGQRRYMESLSSYARQFLGQMEKPAVESIEGLSPAISIDQKSTNRNPRSTVGTVTEIYDYFRLLYARIGIPHCPKCGREVYPSISTAILVLVRKEDSLLLVHARNFKGTFNSLVAGFLETGETLEECVAREVKEETGLDVTNITYFGNQAWPYPSGLMVGFIADYAGGEIKLQEEELSSGDFYTRDNLPELPRKLSLARKMIDWWLECSHK